MPATNQGSTAGGVSLNPPVRADAGGSYSFHQDYNYNYGSTAGGKNVGGGSGDAILVDHPIYIDAPPATHGAGDWVMRLVAQELNPSSIPAGVEILETLYVVPADSETTVRYWEIKNYSGATRTITLRIGGYPILSGVTLVNNAVLTSSEWFAFVMGEGEIIEAKIDTNADGCWFYAHGVETTTA